MLISSIFTALNNSFSRSRGPGAASLAGVLGLIAFKVAAIPMLMLLLFLVYWLLPTCKIRPSQIVPAAMGVGFGPRGAPKPRAQ